LNKAGIFMLLYQKTLKTVTDKKELHCHAEAGKREWIF